MGLLDDDEQRSTFSQLKKDSSKICKCSMKTRVIGYVACFVVGWLISILSGIVFIIKHDMFLFAIFYSFGQIINITGSCFLATPKTQVKDMVKQTRIVLTCFYIGSLIATVVLAFTLPENLHFLVIFTMIIQMISYFLYTLSYVPFGRKLLKKFCQCIISTE